MLEIKVQDKSITTVQKAVFIRGTVGEKVAISCDDEWGDRLKTVVFKRLDPCAEPIVNYIGAVSKTEVVIPHEILQESGKFHIGLYSVMGAETTPTFWSEVFEIEYGTDTDGVAPQPPTPSEYSQLIQLAEETKEIANSVREDADIGVFNGEDGFSPMVDVEQIDGGHRVTITDKNGENTFDVMDGEGGGVSSWNDLEDKPFGEERAFEPIVWDGSIDEANSFVVGESIYARISDAILTPEQIDGAKALSAGSGYGTLRYTCGEAGVDAYNLVQGLDYTDMVIITVADKDASNSFLGTAIPSNGVYSLAYPEIGTYVLSITKETIKPLDEKYIPSSVVLESELESKGYQTEAQVTELINNALGVIENGTY